MRYIIFTIVGLLSAPAVASDFPTCQGSVLERRLGLVELGKLADQYIEQNGTLANLCENSVPGITDAIPARIQQTRVCGSSTDKNVYYTCQLSLEFDSNKGQSIQVLETCHYSLLDQSLKCENRSVVTTFE